MDVLLGYYQRETQHDDVRFSVAGMLDNPEPKAVRLCLKLVTDALIGFVDRWFESQVSIRCDVIVARV